MSANVWYDEVSKGLIEEIKNSVKVKDRTGNFVSLDPKNVFVRKPEDDFKREAFPCVTIYPRGSGIDKNRIDSCSNDLIVTSVNEDTSTVTVEEPAVPFTLSYQIDFWSRYSEEIGEMIRKWLLKHSRQFVLEVVDDGGIVRYCNCEVSSNIVSSDLVQNGKKLMHSIISYNIWVELDDETSYNKPMVSSTNITTERS